MYRIFMEKSVFLFLFLAFYSFPVKARSFLSRSVEISRICWQQFTEPFDSRRSIYFEWPNINMKKTPLPEKTKKRILSHPKVKELRVSNNEGEGLTFDFSYLGKGDKGESIQRVFLIKVIKLIFPKAKIIIRNSNNTRQFSFYYFNQSSKVHIPLKVIDVREFAQQEENFDEYLSSHINIVDMVLLKTANSSQKGLSDKYKKSFPTFSTNSVVSLYLPGLRAMDNPLGDLKLSDILVEFKERGFRKFFLTSNLPFRSLRYEREFFLSYSRYFDKMYFLSRISRKELSQITDQDRVLFFNDLTGYTPVLHSLADVTFVYGPINMLEGIFLDARVIFMENKYHFLKNRQPTGFPLFLQSNYVSLKDEKYRPAFEQLKQTALKTNRAAYIEDIGEVEQALHRLDELSSKPVVYPDEVVLDPSKGDALNQLIERLYFQITENSQLPVSL